MDTNWSDCEECAEFVKEREMTESAVVSGGHEDKEDKEAAKSATLSGGHKDKKDRVRTEKAVLSDALRQICKSIAQLIAQFTLFPTKTFCSVVLAYFLHFYTFW